MRNRGCKVVKIQNGGTEHGNQHKTKAGSSGQGLITGNFTLISLIPALVLPFLSLWELKGGCKVVKIQSEGTEHGNQRQTKAGNSGQGLIPTLGLP